MQNIHIYAVHIFALNETLRGQVLQMLESITVLFNLTKQIIGQCKALTLTFNWSQSWQQIWPT